MTTGPGYAVQAIAHPTKDRVSLYVRGHETRLRPAEVAQLQTELQAALRMLGERDAAGTVVRP
jgi:hypothetical protein